MADRFGEVVDAIVGASTRRRGTGGWLAPELEAALAALRRDHLEAVRRPDRAVFDDRWAQLEAGFQLDELASRILAAAVAADLDPNIPIAYAQLQGNDGTLCVGLALELAGGDLMSGGLRHLSPAGSLARTGLVTVGRMGAFPARSVTAADRLAGYLTGDDGPEPAVRQLLVEPVPVTFAETGRLQAALAAGSTVSYVQAGPGTAGTALAAGALARLDLGYLAVAWPSGATPDTLVSILREATLAQRALILELPADLGTPADSPLRRAGEADRDGRSLFAVLADALVPVVAIGRAPWQPAWLPWIPPVVQAEPLSEAGRLALWSGLAPEVGDSLDLADLPPFRFTPEQIRDVCVAARADADAAGRETRAADLHRVARIVAGTVGQLTGVRRTRPLARLTDLSVADATAAQLRELIGWVRNRRTVRERCRFLSLTGTLTGVAALFAGPSGTGKTMAAQAVAAELGFELLTVDLSAVVDKYIGETEKNLERVFQAAEVLGSVLFFDEADALFGSRSQVTDSRDKYANQETAWLLQRIEAFEGLAILATNLRANLDRAFTRRLSFVVTFDQPDAVLRAELWRKFLGEMGETDPDDPPDIPLLAEYAELSGGEIRNVALSAIHASILADTPLSMYHLLAASSREFEKLGRRMPGPLLSARSDRPIGPAR